jgi:hypothetical protein
VRAAGLQQNGAHGVTRPTTLVANDTISIRLRNFLMNAEQKSSDGNLRERADSGLFSASAAAEFMAGLSLLFRSQLTVTNQRAGFGNEGIARFINPDNVGIVRAPATF